MKRSVWIVVGIVSFYASSEPDGLEKVAEDKGFLDTATDPVNGGLPTADYGISGLDNERLSVGLAGILGVIVVAAIGFGMFWWLGRGSKSREAAESSTDAHA